MPSLKPPLMIYIFSFWLTFRVRIVSVIARMGWLKPARYLVARWQNRATSLNDQGEAYRASLFAQAAHDLRLYLDHLARQRTSPQESQDSGFSGNGHKS